MWSHVGPMDFTESMGSIGATTDGIHGSPWANTHPTLGSFGDVPLALDKNIFRADLLDFFVLRFC